MSVAPLPVLGLESDRKSRRERWSHVVAGFALAFAIVSVVFALLVQLAFAADVWNSPYFNRFRLISLGCLLVGLGMGIYSRETRKGKAAIVLSLLAAALAIALFVEFHNLRVELMHKGAVPGFGG